MKNKLNVLKAEIYELKTTPMMLKMKRAERVMDDLFSIIVLMNEKIEILEGLKK